MPLPKSMVAPVDSYGQLDSSVDRAQSHAYMGGASALRDLEASFPGLGADKAAAFLQQQGDKNASLANQYVPEGPQRFSEAQKTGEYGKWFANNLIQTAPQMGASIAAGAVGTLVGGPMMGAAAAGMVSAPALHNENVQRQEQRGVDDIGARYAATFGNTLLDTALPMGIINKFRKVGSMTKASAAGAAVKGLGVEGFTETGQGVITEAQAGVMPNTSREYLTDRGDEFMAGAAVGGPVAGAGHLASAPVRAIRGAPDAYNEFRDTAQNKYDQVRQDQEDYGLFGSGRPDPKISMSEGVTESDFAQRVRLIQEGSHTGFSPQQQEFLNQYEPQEVDDFLTGIFGNLTGIAADPQSDPDPDNTYTTSARYPDELGYGSSIVEGNTFDDGESIKSNEELVGSFVRKPRYIAMAQNTRHGANNKNVRRTGFEDPIRNLWFDEDYAETMHAEGKNYPKHDIELKLKSMENDKFDYEKVPLTEALDDAGIDRAKFARGIINNMQRKEYKKDLITSAKELGLDGFLAKFSSIKETPKQEGSVANKEQLTNPQLFGSGKQKGIIRNNVNSTKTLDATTEQNGYITVQDEEGNKPAQVFNLLTAVKMRMTDLDSNWGDKSVAQKHEIGRNATSSLLSELSDPKSNFSIPQFVEPVSLANIIAVKKSRQEEIPKSLTDAYVESMRVRQKLLDIVPAAKETKSFMYDAKGNIKKDENGKWKRFVAYKSISEMLANNGTEINEAAIRRMEAHNERMRAENKNTDNALALAGSKIHPKRKKGMLHGQNQRLAIVESNEYLIKQRKALRETIAKDPENYRTEVIDEELQELGGQEEEGMFESLQDFDGAEIDPMSDAHNASRRDDPMDSGMQLGPKKLLRSRDEAISSIVDPEMGAKGAAFVAKDGKGVLAKQSDGKYKYAEFADDAAVAEQRRLLEASTGNPARNIDGSPVKIDNRKLDKASKRISVLNKKLDLYKAERATIQSQRERRMRKYRSNEHINLRTSKSKRAREVERAHWHRMTQRRLEKADKAIVKLEAQLASLKHKYTNTSAPVSETFKQTNNRTNILSAKEEDKLALLEHDYANASAPIVPDRLTELREKKAAAKPMEKVGVIPRGPQTPKMRALKKPKKAVSKPVNSGQQRPEGKDDRYSPTRGYGTGKISFKKKRYVDMAKMPIPAFKTNAITPEIQAWVNAQTNRKKLHSAWQKAERLGKLGVSKALRTRMSELSGKKLNMSTTPDEMYSQNLEYLEAQDAETQAEVEQVFDKEADGFASKRLTDKDRRYIRSLKSAKDIEAAGKRAKAAGLDRVAAELRKRYKEMAPKKMTTNEVPNLGTQGNSIEDVNDIVNQIDAPSMTAQTLRKQIWSKKKKLTRAGNTDGFVYNVEQEIAVLEQALAEKNEPTWDAVNKERKESSTQNLADKMLADTGVSVEIVSNKRAEEIATDMNVKDYARKVAEGVIHAFASNVPTAKGAFEVFINDKLTGKTKEDIMAHELGHAIYNTAWHKADAKTIEGITKDYEKWLKKHGKNTDSYRDLIKSKKSPRAAMLYLQNAMANKKLGNLDTESREYVTDFEEWFADGVSKSLTSKQRAREGTVQAFFHFIATRLKRMLGGDKIGAFVDSLSKQEKLKRDISRAQVSFSKGLSSDPDTKSAMTKFLDIALDKDSRLRTMAKQYNIPVLDTLADMMHKRIGDQVSDKSYWSARLRETGRFETRFGDILNAIPTDMHDRVMEELYSTKTNVSVHTRRVRKLLDELATYMENAGVEFNRRKNYFPQIVDSEFIQGHETEFKAMMARYPVRMKKLAETRTNQAAVEYLAVRGQPISKQAIEDTIALGYVDKVTAKEMPKRLYTQLVESGGVTEQEIQGQQTPGTRFLNTRIFTFMNKADMQDWTNNYLQHSLNDAVVPYIASVVKRSEFERRFGGKRLFKLLNVAREQGATEGQIKQAYDTVSAEMGTYGRETAQWLSDHTGIAMPKERSPINPKLQAVQSTLITASNFLVLGLSAITSIVDPVGIAVRTGELDIAVKAMQDGIKASFDKQSDLVRLTEELGAIGNGAVQEALQHGYQSAYMSKGLKKFNDKMFKAFGLESWTRATRIMAASAAKQFINKHTAGHNKHSQRYMDELGLKRGDVVGDVKLLTYDEYEAADATEQERDDRVRSAMAEFIDTAILRPNPSQRPLYASDPHWAWLFHLKSFSYSFQKTILNRIGHEVNENNYAALMMAGLYLPVAFMGQVMKDMVKTMGDGEDDWDPTYKDSWGFFDYLEDTFNKSGLYGIAQPIRDVAQELKYDRTGIMAIPGPSVDWETYSEWPIPLNYIMDNISK